MKELDPTIEEKIKRCWDVVNSATGAEERRAYEWRQMDKNKKRYVLQRAGLDVSFCDKPLHTLSVSERLKVRRSIEHTIKELEKVKALMCAG